MKVEPEIEDSGSEVVKQETNNDLYKIRVGYLDYTLLYENKVTDIMGKEVSGYFQPEPQLLKVQASLSDAQVAEITIHEIIHAMEHSYDFSLSEKKVERLAIAFATFFKDNPEFMETLILNLQS